MVDLVAADAADAFVVQLPDQLYSGQEKILCDFARVALGVTLVLRFLVVFTEAEGRAVDFDCLAAMLYSFENHTRVHESGSGVWIDGNGARVE